MPHPYDDIEPPADELLSEPMAMAVMDEVASLAQRPEYRGHPLIERYCHNFGLGPGRGDLGEQERLIRQLRDAGAAGDGTAAMFCLDLLHLFASTEPDGDDDADDDGDD